ncbi:hypothetical protein HanXRQr2_Chr12g0531721 [Helianthus annuus]|uniref:Putative GCK n=1 Tax=Helianthus annuus TaxID=4232 RepID=A0A251SZZ2_HELAN|nr:uncharacterized protein LOC110892554 [Helianthus annuus]KAF5777104.1 hypothetical protein HanXRQr2_Chr12g0531721 [Helianthus annuus]KAJ0488703.1 hypothetical protein HanHA300_Chr12g0435751 [Helianthus annuus]KAJ0492257.1 hypothetical protein HanIR_Chr12g0572841 [Helianthus annuus]KAJ0504541.1 hypothetical protein HanHA89_Chr12g0460421 [Helianthus annuus]KAJ0861923.1 hypothetical protein HanPSC8_Chr12g0512221 [Helianthus annuus]
MGTTISIPFFPISGDENPNPTDTGTMSPPQSDTPTTPQPDPTTEPSKPQETQNPNQESTNPTNPDVITDENGNQESEEEGECGFCLFMKGGECKESFINWEKCVEEGEKNGEDIVDKCFEATSALKKCMEANQDYYGVILQAEKDAEEEVSKQLDQQKESGVAGESNSESSSSEKKEEQEQEKA